jgi:hypothetical protein
MFGGGGASFSPKHIRDQKCRPSVRITVFIEVFERIIFLFSDARYVFSDLICIGFLFL